MGKRRKGLYQQGGLIRTHRTTSKLVAWSLLPKSRAQEEIEFFRAFAKKGCGIENLETTDIIDTLAGEENTSYPEMK